MVGRRLGRLPGQVSNSLHRNLRIELDFALGSSLDPGHPRQHVDNHHLIAASLNKFPRLVAGLFDALTLILPEVPADNVLRLAGMVT